METAYLYSVLIQFTTGCYSQQANSIHSFCAQIKIHIFIHFLCLHTTNERKKFLAPFSIANKWENSEI